MFVTEGLEGAPHHFIDEECGPFVCRDLRGEPLVNAEMLGPPRHRFVQADQAIGLASNGGFMGVRRGQPVQVDAA